MLSAALRILVVLHIPVLGGVLLYYIPVPIQLALLLVRKGQKSSRLLHRIPQYESGELAQQHYTIENTHTFCLPLADYHYGTA